MYDAYIFTRKNDGMHQFRTVIAVCVLSIGITLPASLLNAASTNIASQTKGYILLQVEEHGEAWFVRPSDEQRYYMEDGSAAYSMMRYFGLGITNQDLYSIPYVTNTDEMNTTQSICNTNALAKRLSGEILLQVDEHGEAWYVYPATCKRIYLRDGDAAYEIMRYLGLGITNANLAQIAQGEQSTASSSTAERSFPDFDEEDGPWNGSLYLATSNDGIHFGEETRILESAGVPQLLQRQDGTLVLFYQYFSRTDIEYFDVIAYSTSEDNGSTWTDPALITFEGLPEAQSEMTLPMDPTMVELENGQLRLYFTYHAKGANKPTLYSALSETTSLTSSFVVHEEPALTLDDENLLDPAVISFNNTWHHYSWKSEDDNNIHSTSEDGITFTRQDDINLPMDFLGQVITYDNALHFYGTGSGHIVVATSDDGYSWEIEEELNVQGADPGITQLSNGTFIMVYTSHNFNEE